MVWPCVSLSAWLEAVLSGTLLEDWSYFQIHEVSYCILYIIGHNLKTRDWLYALLGSFKEKVYIML